MSLQQPRPYPATISSGLSMSSSIDLAGGYLYVSVLIPKSGTVAAFSTSAGSPVYIQGSIDNVNFFRFYEIYTNTVTNPWNVASSVSGALIPVPSFNFRYCKLEVSGTVTGAGGAVPFQIICTDSL